MVNGGIRFCHNPWDEMLFFIYYLEQGEGVRRQFQKFPLGLLYYEISYPLGQAPNVGLPLLSEHLNSS